MLDICISELICLFEVYIFYDFLHDILGERFCNKVISTAILGVMSIAICITNVFENSQLNLVCVPIVFFAGTFILFCGKTKEKCCCILIYYIIMLGMEFIAGIIFIAISSSELLMKSLYPFNSFFIIIITKLLSYVVLKLLKFVIKRHQTVMHEKFFLMTFQLPCTTVLLYTGLFYSNIQVERFKGLLCIGCILLLFSNVLVFYIIEKMTFLMEQNNEYELMQLQHNLNNKYYQRIEELNIKNARYTHNLKDYLQTIGGLATQNKNTEIIEILKTMEIEIDSIADKFYTSNSILNALVCEKELQAQDYGIDMEIMIEPELYLEHIKNGDLIVMAGNLLDNAIEAASQCKKQKKIELKFFESSDNFIVLHIENTYEHNLKKKGNQYLSTKQNKINHGIGIKNVHETAKKYGGDLFLSDRTELFESVLILSK